MNIQQELDPELWTAIRRSYESGAWSTAVMDGVHFLSDTIRSRSGLQSDGTPLAGQALGGKTPKLKLNRLETETELSIQSGVEQLLRGLYQAIRNPRSHGKVDDSQQDCDALLLFIAYLLRVLGAAKPAFTVDACVITVLDENYVQDKRYSELLVEEIPARHRLDVALALFQKRDHPQARNGAWFLEALVAKFTADELTDFFSAVSQHLRDAKDDALIRGALKCLPPGRWSNVDQIARLRVENRVVRDIGDGRYDRRAKRCNGGALATWATSFFPYFTLKEETYVALVGKLESTVRSEQDYVLQYFFGVLDSLADEPDPVLLDVLLLALRSGDRRFANAMNEGFLWGDAKWPPELQNLHASAESQSPADDDEVPF
jgi:uncharacterized protein (TIGR02391 family)